MKYFKITVKTIIEFYGGDIGNEELYLDIDSGRDYIEDLSIKRHRNELVVRQYRTQRGDLIRDPEVRLDISNGDWEAVEYREDPHTHQIDHDGLQLDDFLCRWATNLEEQFL